MDLLIYMFMLGILFQLTLLNSRFLRLVHEKLVQFFLVRSAKLGCINLGLAIHFSYFLFFLFP